MGFTLDTERMGYFVRADQFVGGHREIRLGGSLYSLIAGPYTLARAEAAEVLLRRFPKKRIGYRCVEIR